MYERQRFVLDAQHAPCAFAELCRRYAIFEVDPLACPTCHGAMRIIACITQASVIGQILTHLRTRAATGARTGARSPPSTRAPATRDATRRPPSTAAASHHTP